MNTIIGVAELNLGCSRYIKYSVIHAQINRDLFAFNLKRTQELRATRSCAFVLRLSEDPAKTSAGIMQLAHLPDTVDSAHYITLPPLVIDKLVVGKSYGDQHR